MSGPIIRKYGFPDFDRIFGSKPIQHGKETQAEPAADPDSSGQPADLPHSGEKVDPKDPSSAGTIAPATEFGGAVD